MVVRYFRNLNAGRLILWCYFIWYLVVLVRYFEPSPRLWLTSLGLSLIVGAALCLNAARSGPAPVRIGFWPTVRFFMMPFCVSSFSALVKDRHFILIFSPNYSDVLIGVGLCVTFCLASMLAKLPRGAR